MRSIWLLARNDLRLTMKDRPAFFWMLVLPVAMMWLFGSMGGGASGPPTVSLDVVSHDDGWLAAAFTDELEGDEVRLRRLTPEQSAAAEGTVRTLVIPQGFTAGVLAGEPQKLRLVKAADSSESFGVAAEVIITRAIVRTLGRLVELSGDPQAEQRFRALGDRPRLVSLAVSQAGEGQPVPQGRAQSVPGMLTFTVMMMTLIYGAVFLTLEKQNGMLRRHATLPISRRQLFLGKLLGRLLLSSMQITILVLAGRFLFGISWGRSPLGLVLVIAAYAIAVAGLATFFGAILRNAAQASSVCWLASMVMAALGGCWWPAEVMPRWMWSFAHVVPTAWAMQAFHSLISFGRGLDAVLLPAAVLVLFGAVASLVGIRLLRVHA